MTTQIDSSITVKKETVFGTPVTVDTSYSVLAEDLTYIPTYVQGAGKRYGSRVAAAASRVLGKEEVGGSFTVEADTKGLGKLFEAAIGVGTSTLISGTSYQQLFTPLVDDFLPSYTIQKGVPPIGGGVSSPHTFAGMVCSGFEMAADNAGIPTIKFNWVGKSLATGTAFVAPSYLSGQSLFSFVNGSVRIGGAVTVPSTTVLASGGTAAANVRSFDLNYENGLDTEGFNFGATGQRSRKPVIGERMITGNLEVEYDSNTLRDAYIAQTDLALVLTFATTTAISGANFPTLQITIPDIRLEGGVPNGNLDGSPIVQSIDFTTLDGRVAAHPFYLAIVTPETAI